MTDFAAAAINLPSQARRLNAFGAIDLRLTAADTAGRMGVVETVAQPLEGPPLHVHTREDEMFFVLAGTFQFICGDEQFIGGVGTNVLLPRNVPHTFRNIGTTEGRLLVTVTPGGFEGFFVEIDRLGATEPSEIMAIAARFGLSFLPPRAEAA